MGNSPAIPLTKVIERLEGKVDQLIEGQSSIRERLARLEGVRRNPSIPEIGFEP